MTTHRPRLSLALIGVLTFWGAADGGEFEAITKFGNCCSSGGPSQQDSAPVCIPEWSHQDGVGHFAANAFTARGALSGDVWHTHIGVVGDYSAQSYTTMKFDDVVFQSPGSDPIVVRWNLVAEGETNDASKRSIHIDGVAPSGSWSAAVVGTGFGTSSLADWDGIGTHQFQSPPMTLPVNTPVSLSLRLRILVGAGSAGVQNTATCSLTLPPKGAVFDAPAGVTVQSAEALIENNVWKAGTIRVPKDFKTIQAAIDASGPGSRIRIAGGTYLETLVIACAKDLTLEVDKGSAVIDAGNSPSGIAIDESSGVTIRGLTVKNGVGHGVDVRDSPWTTIEKVKVIGSGADGIHVEASDDLTIDKCKVSNAGNSGVHVEDCDRPTVTKTKVSGAQVDGIVVGQVNETSIAPVLTNNSVTGVAQAGILVVGPGATVEKNKVKDAVGVGLVVESDAATVVKNKVSKGGIGGVFIGHGMVVEKNKISKPAGPGLELQGDGVAASKNSVAKAGGDGLVIATTNSTFEKNTATKPAGRGVVVEGDGNTLTSNKSTKAGAVGFEVNASGNTFFKNKAKKSGEYDLSDTAGGNAYTSNKFPKVDPDNQP